MFEKGDKVICNIDFYEGIEYGKEYTVAHMQEFNPGFFTIRLDDMRGSYHYHDGYFISELQQRRNKIEKIMEKLNGRLRFIC